MKNLRERAKLMAGVVFTVVCYFTIECNLLLMYKYTLYSVLFTVVFYLLYALYYSVI